MSNNAILAALRRMGIGKEEMTGHGFRAMARTILDEVLGFRPDFIEHQLAHAVLRRWRDSRLGRADRGRAEVDGSDPPFLPPGSALKRGRLMCTGVPSAWVGRLSVPFLGMVV